jgi:hypothetical protein
MLLVLRYFWFFCAAVMSVNIVIWRRRLRTVVSRGSAKQDDVDRFLRGAAASLIGGPILLGLIALAAGWSSPCCAGVLEFDTLPRALTSGVIVAESLALLFWIWLGKGADLLAVVGPRCRGAGTTGEPTQYRLFAWSLRRYFSWPRRARSSVGAPCWRHLE